MYNKPNSWIKVLVQYRLHNCSTLVCDAKVVFGVDLAKKEHIIQLSVILSDALVNVCFSVVPCSKWRNISAWSVVRAGNEERVLYR